MLKGKSILVVDDEPDLREILCDEFAFAGAKASGAANGTEAYAKVQAAHFDLVISDLRMPGGDGITLAKAMKSNPHGPTLLLMTGFADLTPEDAYEIGAEGFITKPFHLEGIRQTVSRLLTPALERWAAPQAPAPAVIEADDSIFAGHPTESYLGRGGIFLPGGRLSQDQEVGFKIGSWLDGKGVVRWVRPGSQQGRKPGVGLEFLHLEPQSLKLVQERLAAQQPRAYLPKGF